MEQSKCKLRNFMAHSEETKKKIANTKNKLSTYPLLDYAQIKYCQCGCGERIKISYDHRYRPVKYIQGHGRKKKINEFLKQTLICACGCGQQIKLQKFHHWGNLRTPPKFIKGHYGSVRKTNVETEIAEFLKQVIYCRCGCGNKVTIRRYHRYKGLPEYICGHKPISDEHRRKNSEAQIERVIKNNGVAHGINGFKVGKFYSQKTQKEIHFESSYEEKAYIVLEKSDAVIEYDRCNFGIAYYKNGGIHRYIPDIIVTYKTGKKSIIEIKPENLVKDSVNQSKFKAAKEYCKINNLEFLIWTEKELF